MGYIAYEAKCVLINVELARSTSKISCYLEPPLAVGSKCEAYKMLVYERNIYAKLCERGSTLSKDPYNRHKKSTSTLVERLQITRTQGKCTSDE